METCKNYLCISLDTHINDFDRLCIHWKIELKSGEEMLNKIMLNNGETFIFFNRKEFEHKSYILYKCYQMFNEACAEHAYEYCDRVIKNMFIHDFKGNYYLIKDALTNDRTFHTACTCCRKVNS